MVHPKAMGIGAMFVLLILAVILLAMNVRYIGKNEPHYSISGFQNQRSDVMYKVPAVAASAGLPNWNPDPNTNYLCRSPAGSGYTPCEEGSFCDGTSNSCVKQFPPSNININDGYYS
jgi:hypothetical protein